MGNYEDTVFGRACWVPLTMIPMSHLKKRRQQYYASNRSRRLQKPKQHFTKWLPT